MEASPTLASLADRSRSAAVSLWPRMISDKRETLFRYEASAACASPAASRTSPIFVKLAERSRPPRPPPRRSPPTRNAGPPFPASRGGARAFRVGGRGRPRCAGGRPCAAHVRKLPPLPLLAPRVREPVQQLEVLLEDGPERG